MLNVPKVITIFGANISIALLTNGKDKSSSSRFGVRPPGVRQKINGIIETFSRDISIADNILSLNPPAGPDNIFPDKSSSILGKSVIINNPFGLDAIFGKTTFVALK